MTETTSKEVASKAGWYLAQVKSPKFKKIIGLLKQDIRYGRSDDRKELEGLARFTLRLLNAGKSLAASCATQAPDKPKAKKKTDWDVADCPVKRRQMIRHKANPKEYPPPGRAVKPKKTTKRRK